jgi:hypothetical protein
MPQRRRNPVSPAKKKDQEDVTELLAGMDLEITTTDKPPRKTAAKVPRKPSVFDEALKDSVETGSWKRFEVPTRLVKSTRFELIRAARSFDMKVTTRTGPVEQSIASDEEEKTAIYFQTTWKEED